MKVKYIGSMPIVFTCPEFTGLVKPGDVIEIGEATLKEKASIFSKDLGEISPDNKKLNSKNKK